MVVDSWKSNTLFETSYDTVYHNKTVWSVKIHKNSQTETHIKLPDIWNSINKLQAVTVLPCTYWFKQYTQTCIGEHITMPKQMLQTQLKKRMKWG